MKMVLTAILVLFTVPVWAMKPCEELKTEIAAKIEAKGVKAYSLEIVPKAEATAEQSVVGSCDGGKSVIVYKRGG